MEEKEELGGMERGTRTSVLYCTVLDHARLYCLSGGIKYLFNYIVEMPVRFVTDTITCGSLGRGFWSSGFRLLSLSVFSAAWLRLA
jgi:hypothetical protein